MTQRVLFVVNIALLAVFAGAFYGQGTARAQSSAHYQVQEAGIVKCANGVNYCANSKAPDFIDNTWQVRGYDSKRDLLIMEKQL